MEIERCDDNGEGSEGEQAGTTEKTCYTIWESRLTGYSVSNQATVKIRNLDDVGTIIDQGTEAAGNLVRINGISFNIEDPQPLRDEARADAVSDMKRKATMLAELSGVKLGRLVYLNEGRGLQPAPAAIRAGGGRFRHGGFLRDLDFAWRNGHFRHSPGVFLIAEESE